MSTAEPALPTSFREGMPTITVVLVNLDGEDMLGPCLDSLGRQTYDPDLVEVILIDNASTDGSVDMVRRRYPHVRVIVNDVNVGFAPAVNQGARLANGEYLALLNNDAEADPNWLVEAALYLMGHEEVGCVASLILSEDRASVDYAGSAMAFNGMGYALHNSKPAHEIPGYAEPTLFASGGAMVTPTALFVDAGGFDESYFAFFEDVDYGWRLWILGHETHFVPASKVLHRHHGTIKRFGYARERYLLERNALATIYKNYGDDNLARVLPGAVLLTLMRGLSDVDDDHDLPDFAITPDAANLDDTDVPISALSAAHLAAMRDFGRALPTLTAKRSAVQGRRVASDAEVLPLFRESLRPNVGGIEYTEVFDAVLEAFDLTDALAGRARVLIVTGDTLSARMAGPAIRAYEMATVLTQAGFEVTLASTSPPEIAGREVAGRRFTVTHAGPPGALMALLDSIDIVIFQGFVMHAHPEIESFDGPVVVDIYDPFHLENMTARKHELDWFRYTTHNSDLAVLNRQLERGDFFVCASEKQRDFWLGQMSALRRINPATFDDDESLRSLIDVAPFGLPGGPPVRTMAKAIRGVVPGIEPDDFLLIWGGGIYNWFDPLTLIEAVGRVAAEHPDVKLFFMGNAHPNPEIPKMAMASNAYVLAEKLGLLGTHVFFNEGWVEYGERQNYLLEADVGVSTHYEHLETRYSFRTRILDYIWCELPIIATEGDTLSLLAKERGLGIAIPPEDVDACADAIRRLREDRAFHAECVANLQAIKPDMTWDRAMAPIVEFCMNPRRAADVTGVRRAYVKLNPMPGDVVPPRSALYYGRRFLENARQQGPRAALTHARNIVRHYTRRT
ncbi:glycosyltransferase [Euzebya sp.]|uniref:glycosyltransferase n=1 Tax=Euzebya sp. TaxID=1971409 RepID=UPI003513F05E